MSGTASMAVTLSPPPGEECGRLGRTRRASRPAVCARARRLSIAGETPALRGRAPRAWPSRCLHRLAEIGLDDHRIVADVVGRPLRDGLAEVEDDDPLADSHHQLHVV